jgi:hypothetical protein
MRSKPIQIQISLSVNVNMLQILIIIIEEFLPKYTFRTLVVCVIVD